MTAVLVPSAGHRLRRTNPPEIGAEAKQGVQRMKERQGGWFLFRREYGGGTAIAHRTFTRPELLEVRSFREHCLERFEPVIGKQRRDERRHAGQARRPSGALGVGVPQRADRAHGRRVCAVTQGAEGGDIGAEQDHGHSRCRQQVQEPSDETLHAEWITLCSIASATGTPKLLISRTSASQMALVANQRAASGSIATTRLCCCAAARRTVRNAVTLRAATYPESVSGRSPSPACRRIQAG